MACMYVIADGNDKLHQKNWLHLCLG